MQNAEIFTVFCRADSLEKIKTLPRSLSGLPFKLKGKIGLCLPADFELMNQTGRFTIPHMPIYEFHCEKCGADSEVLVRSSRWQGTACPKCGARRLTKKLSVFASSVGGESSEAASCSGNPGSCGMCGTGRPHSH
jgi:putative FmdB family regulatory protein